jgi:Bacterial extracellular solute-binding protein
MRRLSRIIAIGYFLVCLATLVGTALVGPLGYAPFPLPIGPARTPVVVTFWYGTEKEAWLKEAVTRYEATAPTLNGRPIQIELKGLGSRDMVERVAQQQWGNDSPPTVISPASSLWVELLKSDWLARNPGSPPIVAAGVEAAQPLVLTPLVLVAWEDRAKVLWPKGPPNLWRDLHDALADPQGWVGRGGPGSWGFVKFGHTSPLTSNSGTQTLLLLAYGFYNKTSKLSGDDILNPEFQQWLTEVEQGVTEFGDSTGTFMTNMVRFGPSKYDVVAVYENLALQDIETAQGRWGQSIRIYYPPATLLSDHPYVTLQAPWTTPEQRAAATHFRDFLLSRPIQELALQSGFRPADPAVAVASNDPNNPFNKYKSFGVQIDIGQQVETPPADVISTLLDLWRRKINK